MKKFIILFFITKLSLNVNGQFLPAIETSPCSLFTFHEVFNCKIIEQNKIFEDDDVYHYYFKIVLKSFVWSNNLKETVKSGDTIVFFCDLDHSNGRIPSLVKLLLSDSLSKDDTVQFWLQNNEDGFFGEAISSKNSLWDSHQMKLQRILSDPLYYPCSVSPIIDFNLQKMTRKILLEDVNECMRDSNLANRYKMRVLIGLDSSVKVSFFRQDSTQSKGSNKDLNILKDIERCLLSRNLTPSEIGGKKVSLFFWFDIGVEEVK